MWHAAGYFDESDDNDRAYAVAGFIGHQMDFLHFEWVWREKILEKYNLEYFKASELSSGKGQFQHLRDEPDNLEDRLFSEKEKNLFNKIKAESIDIIVQQELLVGLGVIVVRPDYERLLEEYKSSGTLLPHPYFICAHLVMVESGFIINRINHDLSKSQQGLLRPVFDSHEQYSGKAKQVFDEFCGKNPITSRCLLPPIYETEQDYVMLQAADNLAYECRRLLVNLEHDKTRPERKAMTRLKERVYKIYKLDYCALKTIIEAQQPDAIPFEADIHNRHQLIQELDQMEKEQNEKFGISQIQHADGQAVKGSAQRDRAKLSAEKAAKKTKGKRTN